MPRRSDVIRAKRRAVGGKRDRCKLGTSCGAACINRNKACLINAPTPVANSIPIAIAAIQSRRERLGPRERIKILRRRKLYSREKRKDLLNKQLFEIANRLAALSRSGNKSAYDKLESNFLRLLEQFKSLGGKAKASKGSTWELFKDVRDARAKDKIREVTDRIKRGMESAIASRDRNKYNKLESKLLRIAGKAGEYLPDKGYLSKGSMWVSAIAKGKKEEIARYVARAERGMMRAIENKDKAKYDRIEGGLLRLRDKLGSTYSGSLLGSKRKGAVWDRYSLPINTAERLNKSDLFKGAREGVTGVKLKVDGDKLSIDSKVLGNTLQVLIEPNSTSFFVNGSVTASGAGDLTRRERIAIVREVRRQYEEIFKSIDDGTVFSVTASSGDGRKEMRTDAYVKGGFSDPEKEGGMYGKIVKGSVVPITREEFERRVS